MTAPLLEIDELTVDIADVPVLRGVSLTVAASESATFVPSYYISAVPATFYSYFRGLKN